MRLLRATKSPREKELQAQPDPQDRDFENTENVRSL
jgi:hypothetical protein